MWGNTNYFLTCERFLSEACSVACFFTMCVFTKDKAILHFRFAGLSSVVSELCPFFSIRTEMKHFVSSNKACYNKYMVIVAYNSFIFLIVLG